MSLARWPPLIHDDSFLSHVAGFLSIQSALVALQPAPGSMTASASNLTPGLHGPVVSVGRGGPKARVPLARGDTPRAFGVLFASRIRARGRESGPWRWDRRGVWTCLKHPTESRLLSAGLGFGFGVPEVRPPMSLRATLGWASQLDAHHRWQERPTANARAPLGVGRCCVGAHGAERTSSRRFKGTGFHAKPYPRRCSTRHPGPASPACPFPSFVCPTGGGSKVDRPMQAVWTGPRPPPSLIQPGGSQRPPSCRSTCSRGGSRCPENPLAR